MIYASRYGQKDIITLQFDNLSLITELCVTNVEIKLQLSNHYNYNVGFGGDKRHNVRHY